MEAVRAKKVGQLWQSAKSALEVAATIMVIVASGAVLTLTVANWRERRDTSSQNEQPPDPPPPARPHQLDGAALLGNRNATVVIVQYSDFECQFCRQFVRDTWPELKIRYVDSGRVLAAFRHLPLPSHQHARHAAVSANCAGRQDKFWEMHDRLFEHQETLTADTTSALASQLGLNNATFDDCVRHHRTDDLSADRNYALTSGIRATPTFLIGVMRPDKAVKVTKVLVGAHPLVRFTDTLDELLADRRTWPFSWFRRRS